MDTSQKETADAQERERQNKSVEFELCLKRIVSLIQNRETLNDELKKYERETPCTDYLGLDIKIKEAIKAEANFLANL